MCLFCRSVFIYFGSSIVFSRVYWSLLWVYFHTYIGLFHDSNFMYIRCVCLFVLFIYIGLFYRSLLSYIYIACVGLFLYIHWSLLYVCFHIIRLFCGSIFIHTSVCVVSLFAYIYIPFVGLLLYKYWSLFRGLFSRIYASLVGRFSCIYWSLL